MADAPTSNGKSRIYILRDRKNDKAAPRLIDAKSETAALVWVADSQYTIEIAKPRDVQAAYEAGAKMEHVA